MESIFSYSNYRQYLKDYYEDKKSSSRFFSHQYFAKKAGIQSANYLKLVMDGERNLGPQTILNFAKGMGLDEKETVFFATLVKLNQAKLQKDIDKHTADLELLRLDFERSTLTEAHYAMLTSWHFAAIKELLLLPNQEATPKAIARRLNSMITPEKAKDALSLLKEIGMIEQDKHGAWIIHQQNSQTVPTTNSKTVAQFHRDVLDLAKESIDTQKSDERCLSALTFAIEKKKLPEAFKRIHEFRNEMDTYFSTKKKPFDAVYQLNIQLFRLDQDD